MKKNYSNYIDNYTSLFSKLSKVICLFNFKHLVLLFLLFSNLSVTYAQCNVVKGGDFPSAASASTNWSLPSVNVLGVTNWYYVSGEAYIERDGIGSPGVSLKQTLNGLIGGVGKPLTLSFKIRGQNAGRKSGCPTSATLVIKIGGTTYMTIVNPDNNSAITTDNITPANGATYTQTGFPLNAVGNEADINQGIITITIPWESKPLTADLEFVATSSLLLQSFGCAAWGGDDWFLDDISVVPFNPTVYTMTSSTLCFGTTAAITLNGSQLGVNYELRRGTTVVETRAGTGNALNFTNQTDAGTYTIVGVLTGTTTCTTTMNGSVVINPLPTTSNAGPDQSTCGLTSVALAGNNPTVGTGSWSIVSGTGGTITTPSSPTSTFSGTAGTTYTLRWTISNSLCPASTDDVIIRFNQNPIVSITGNTNICLGSTTTLSPSTGGTWQSSNPSVATVTNAGVVTGVAAGNATFTFTNSTTNCTATTAAVTVSPGISTVFNSSGTFTVPAGVTSLQVEAWGGGGSGGTAAGNPSAGGGGAGGAYVRNTSISVTPNNTYTVTVGAGGAAPTTAVAGNPGGQSWFGSTTTILAVGGNGGGVASGNNSNGAGGSVVSTGNVGGTAANLYGGAGGAGTGAATGGSGGTGANGGTGGVGSTNSANGASGNILGGGGAGGRASGNTDRYGGSGGAGRVIITIASPTASAGGGQSICPNGTATVSGATATNGTILWTHNGAGSLSNTTTLTPTYTAAAADTGNTVTLTMTVSNGSCVASDSDNYTVTVNNVPTIAAITTPAALCSGTSFNPTAPTVTANGSTINSQGWQISTTVGGSTYTSLTLPYTVSFADNGKNIRYTATNGCGTTTSNVVVLTVNNINASTAVVTAQPNCSVLTGSITLGNLPSTGTINQTINGVTTNISISGGGSQTITGLAPGSYTFTVSNGGCTSGASTPVDIVAFSGAIAKWDGTNWSSTPTINDRVEFNASYSSGSTANAIANVNACSCYINNNAAVVFNTGHTLNVINEVVVNEGTGITAALTFEDKASLVQHKDVPFLPNAGSITYKRKTTITRYDYTYWASPVEGRTLKQLSPNTLFDRYFTYNNGWKVSMSGAATMIAGHGYIARGPQPYSITAPTDFTGIFIGDPHNGVYNGGDLAVVPNIDYLLGNPYPSAIDADKFLDANATILQGTLYFWTHNTEPVAATGTTTYKYTASDYASYNKTGGAGTAGGNAAGSGGKIPSGKIGAGQGFFARAIGTGNVLFNNSMRLAATPTTYLDNSQFFKLNTGKNATATVATTEKNRVWLNLTNAEGAFKQILVGYITGATNQYDNGFDGVTYNGNQYLDFYSVNNEVNLVIQGRALPFVRKDSVPLGYKSTIKGDFKINIDQTDGFLSTQNILLEDKGLKILHDLKKEPYVFTTEIGTFNSRFVLRYVDKNAVDEVIPEIPDELNKSVVVALDKNQITIKSGIAAIDKVFIYDSAGKKLYQKNKVDASVFVISHLISSHQVLVVDILLADGTTHSRKIVY